MAADRGSGAADSASAEIGKYLDILAKDPNSRVFAPLAEAYRKAGLLDDAIETALEGLRIHPNYLGGRVALGRALFGKKRYAEAADELRKVVKAAPDNIIAHKVLGQIALAQGNLPDAEKAFRTVTFLDPHDREAKKALDDIGSAAAVPPAAPAAAPAPPPSIAPESSWLEIPSEPLPAAAPPEAAEPHAAAEAIPFARVYDIGEESEQGLSPLPGELEEPDEAPPSPAGSTPEPEAAGLPVLEEMSDEETATPGPESPLEIEIFGRQPAVIQVTPPPPVASEPETEEPVFEVFTRVPRGEEPPRRGEERTDRPMFEELVLEPTAHLPQDLEEGEPPVIEPPEETPRISVLDDFALEMERSFADVSGAAAVPAPAAPPAVEPVPVEAGPAGEEIGWEEEAVWLPSAEEEEAPVARPEELFSLEEEDAAVDPGGEIAPQPLPLEEGTGEAVEEAAEEAVEEAAGETFADLEVPEVEPAGQPAAAPAAETVTEPPVALPPEPSAGRGIFDTETLATIYINQGFYGRAAAIYERLVAGSPDDAQLRRKLDEVRALERAQGGPTGEDTTAAGAAAPAAGSERAETIRRLEALMEAFRRGRGR